MTYKQLWNIKNQQTVRNIRALMSELILNDADGEVDAIKNEDAHKILEILRSWDSDLDDIILPTPNLLK